MHNPKLAHILVWQKNGRLFCLLQYFFRFLIFNCRSLRAEKVAVKYHSQVPQFYDGSFLNCGDF